MLSDSLQTMVKRKDFLICIDSDGTAMDVMNIKHKKCFGPCFVKEWGLEKFEKEVLGLWNDINLYRRTRGNNRFLTLYMALEEVNGHYKKIDGLPELKDWLDTASSLSNQCLSEAIEKTDSNILKKALSWSQSVNAATALLTYDDKKPFGGLREFLDTAVKFADIAVVSSAGRAVIKEEWQYHGLDKYLSVIVAQEDGTKKVCLEKLAQKGYEKGRILMVGDALSDMEAAKAAGVLFYPMIVDKECESWNLLKSQYIKSFKNESYLEIQNELINNFTRYFGE